MILGNEKGITLIELVIGAGLSTLIILLGSTLFINSQIDERNVSQNIDVVYATMLASKNVSRQLALAGGANLRPWNSVAVENDCAARASFPACQSSDRITVANEKINPATNLFLPSHRIVSFTHADGRLVVDLEDPGDGTPRCLMTAATVAQHIVMIDALSSTVYYRWVTAFDLATCTFTTATDAQGEIMNSANATTANYASGLFTEVTVKTVYRDPVTNRLNRLMKKNNNLATMAADELITLENDVYDLQIGLAYDADPPDGALFSDGSTTDEIFYNNTGDTFATLSGGKAKIADLRMLNIALTLGTTAMKTEKKGNKVQFLDGPEVTVADRYLFGFERRFYLRNILSNE